MGLFSAIGSGVGAAGKGVGSLGFGLGKAIWNSGAGGKGFLIGGVGGGIYGAASADPRMGESRLKGALWGVGIGGVGGAIGGLAIGAGFNKAKGAIAGMGAKGPSANAISKMANARAIREQMMNEKVTRGIMNWSRRGGGRIGPGELAAPVRLRREPRALTKLRGAFGSAVNRAKNYKRQWVANHRARGIRRLERAAGLSADNVWTPPARNIASPAGSAGRTSEGLPWGMKTDGRTFDPDRITPLDDARWAARKARITDGRTFDPDRITPLDDARWAARKARIQAGAPMAGNPVMGPGQIRSVGENVPTIKGYATPPVSGSVPGMVTPAEEARWAGRRNQIYARQAGLNPVGGGAYPPGAPRGEGWVMPGHTPPMSAAESQRLARAGANRSSPLASYAYGPSRSDAVDALAAEFGAGNARVRAALGLA